MQRIFTVCLLGVILLICSIRVPLFAQADSAVHLRISLLTVGVGNEIYASFGHTGIRVTDSAAGRDVVYNWGTFDGYQDNFELKFAQGKLLYYASSESYPHFIQTYIQEQRGVEEQELLLTWEQKRALYKVLEESLSEENKYYKYDFLFDNCATRPRDIFKSALGASFKWGVSLPPGMAHRSFREETDRYLAHLPWERFGINLLLGSPVDRIMGNEDAMFLPDNLRDGLSGAMLDGRHAVSAPERILPPARQPPAPSKAPFYVMLVFSAFVIGGSAIPGIKPLATIAGQLMLIITGLLGCLMVFMWLGTDHQSCRNNFNVLWALPTNLVIPFVKARKQSRYALVAMALIVVAVLIHIIGIQTLPIGIIWPLLLALMAFFGMIYRSATHPAIPDEHDAHHHH